MASRSEINLNWSQLCEPKNRETTFDIQTFVQLPNRVCSSTGYYATEDPNGENNHKLKWEKTKKGLHAYLKNEQKHGDGFCRFKNCILSYNNKLICNFSILDGMLKFMRNIHGEHEVQDVLTFIVESCLKLDDKFEGGLKLLTSNHQTGFDRVEICSEDVCSLLASGFLCNSNICYILVYTLSFNIMKIHH